MEKNVVVDHEDVKQIAPFFRTFLGSKLVDAALRFCAIDKVNALYSRCCSKRGPAFTQALLDDLHIQYRINNPELLEKLPEGAFITVSNHPFGALDGIMLITIMGKYRPDYKVMVNSMLTYIEAMSPNFIAVEPYSHKKGSSVNMQGIKESIRHLRQGHPIGFFPAGGVSKIQSNLRIEDQPWAHNILRLIRQMNVPVVPVYFHGHNTVFFYILGLISWKLRSLRLASEVFRSQGRVMPVSIGRTIGVDEQNQYETLEELGEFLRGETYKAGKPYRK